MARRETRLAQEELEQAEETRSANRFVKQRSEAEEAAKLHVVLAKERWTQRDSNPPPSDLG